MEERPRLQRKRRRRPQTEPTPLEARRAWGIFIHTLPAYGAECGARLRCPTGDALRARRWRRWRPGRRWPACCRARACGCWQARLLAACWTARASAWPSPGAPPRRSCRLLACRAPRRWRRRRQPRGRAPARARRRPRPAAGPAPALRLSRPLRSERRCGVWRSGTRRRQPSGRPRGAAPLPASPLRHDPTPCCVRQRSLARRRCRARRAPPAAATPQLRRWATRLASAAGPRLRAGASLTGMREKAPAACRQRLRRALQCRQQRPQTSWGRATRGRGRAPHRPPRTLAAGSRCAAPPRALQGRPRRGRRPRAALRCLMRGLGATAARRPAMALRAQQVTRQRGARAALQRPPRARSPAATGQAEPARPAPRQSRAWGRARRRSAAPERGLRRGAAGGRRAVRAPAPTPPVSSRAALRRPRPSLPRPPPCG